MTFKQTLNQYKDQGLLMNQVHPVHPLIIWNYTPKVQYEALWDDITIQCRGLVTDFQGNVIAKGFNKFFNIEENRHIPTDDFEVFEKLDGQLILVFWYKGEMIVASRGSFTSKYAKEAKRILNSGYNRAFEGWAKGDGKTVYCFELIGFEQIVVSYPEVDLIMTGAFDYFEDENEWDEIDLQWSQNYMMFVDTDIKLVKKFKGLDWKNIKQLNWENSEGFVVRFSNGDRCKIKFEDYIKLHRQMTNLSTTAIWEALMNGQPVSSILNDVPDEFFEKVHDYEAKLLTEFADLEADIRSRYLIEKRGYDNLMSIHGYTEHEARKQLADNVNAYPHRSAVFSMLNEKDYSKHIWKQIEPEFEKI